MGRGFARSILARNGLEKFVCAECACGLEGQSGDERGGAGTIEVEIVRRGVVEPIASGNGDSVANWVVSDYKRGFAVAVRGGIVGVNCCVGSRFERDFD